MARPEQSLPPLAGNSDIRMALGVYTHVELQDQTAAIGALAGPTSARA